jgi:TrmH family RNA methyltransferase
MKYTTIMSLSNPVIKSILKLKKKKNKQQRNLFLIDTPHLIEMALMSDFADIEKVFLTENFFNKNKLFLRRLEKTIKALNKPFLFVVTDEIISRLSDTEAPQGIVSLLSYKRIELEEIRFKAVPFIVICDGIQDPGNLGTIVRAADAAGADAIIILPNTCDIFMPKALRATAGSVFNIPVVYTTPQDLFLFLKNKNIAFYATSVNATLSIYDCDFRSPLAIAFGNEAQGISKSLLEKADYLIKIPIFGKAESLNVAMAAAVSLYEVVRQRMF